MDFFNSLWNDPEQTRIPSAENFAQDITTEKWINQSSTFKIISGTLKHPQEWMQIDKYFNNSSKKTSNSFRNKVTSIGRKPDVEKKQEKSKTEDGETDDDSDDDTMSEAGPSVHESRAYVPGLRKNPFIDKLSCMDNNEHAECLSLFLKFSKFTGNVIMPSDRSDHFKFEVMYKKVQEEQKAFSQAALNQWLERAEDTQKVCETHMRPLQTIWMVKTKKALEFYPHVYKRRLMVPLLPGGVKVEMVKMSDLLQMGRIPAFFHPPLIKRTKLHTTISKMLQSTQYNLQPDEVVGSLHKLPVSRDPNAESLARLHKAQIVISYGALATLMETYFDFSKTWTLPISVKEYRTIEKGKTTTKTIVFIDKPLPKQSMPANECHRFIFKHGVKARLLSHKHQLCFTFPIPGVDLLDKESTTTSNESPTDAKDDESVQNPEESTCENNQNKTVKKESRDVSSEGDAADDSEDEKLIIEEPLDPPKRNNLNDVSNNAEKLPDPTPSNIDSTTTNLGTTQKRQEPFKRKDGLRLPKTADGFTAPTYLNNVTYSSWVIRPEDNDQLSVHQKKALKELSVIVRCRVDGCQRVDGDFAALSLSAKVEYQVEYTAEEATKDELVREWASLFFKPASHVLRTRVDVRDGEIVMCEKKDKFQIAADAQRMHGLRLSDSLQTLYSVFAEVSSLTKGSYLLHHSPEENAFASLEESIESTFEDSKSVRNLENCFAQKFCVSSNPNPTWRKLDSTLVMPRHELLKTMPATYRPKPCAMTFKARKIPAKEKKEGRAHDQNRRGFPTKKNRKRNRKNKSKNKNNKPDNKE